MQFTVSLSTDSRCSLERAFEAPLLALPPWLFAKRFWPVYMKRVLENVRAVAEGDAPCLYA